MCAVDEVYERQPEVKGIADVPEENANSEQVTSTKTHDCNS